MALIIREDNMNMRAIQLLDGLVVSDNTFLLPSTSNKLILTATNADSLNYISLLVRDDADGSMKLVKLVHNFCTVNCNPIPSQSNIPSGNIQSPYLQGPNAEPGVGDGLIGSVDIKVVVPAVVVPAVVLVAGLIVLLVLLRRRKKKGSLLHGKSRVEIAMGKL